MASLVAQTVEAVAILPSSIFPERSIALVKRLVHQRAEIDRTCPTLTKVLLKGTHSYIH
jgi:hypothetical protein